MQQAIDAIGNLFKADWKEKLSIEEELNMAVCASERIAFMDGLRMGIGLVSGRLFYDDLPELN